MCEVTEWHGAVFALWAALEFWLGRTNLIHSGSTVELIFNGIRTIMNLIKPKGDNNGI